MEEQLELNKSLAIKCFNLTWTLIEKEDRSQEDIDRMINAAHASRYHWEVAGKAVNLARGEWLISRVYAILKRAEPCLYHADRCLKVTLESNLQDFDLAFAYEAVARASKLAGDEVGTAKYILQAKEAGAKIADMNDRAYFFSELETIQPGSE